MKFNNGQRQPNQGVSSIGATRLNSDPFVFSGAQSFDQEGTFGNGMNSFAATVIKNYAYNQYEQ